MIRDVIQTIASLHEIILRGICLNLSIFNAMMTCKGDELVWVISGGTCTLHQGKTSESS